MFTLEKASHWAQIIGGVVAVVMLVLYVQAMPSTAWGALAFDRSTSVYLMPAFVGLCIVLAAVFHFLAVRHKKDFNPSPSTSTAEGSNIAAHRQTVDKLNECESLLKHWKGEVEREQLMRKEQVEIRDRQIGEKGGRIGVLEQELRVTQDRLDAFTVPAGSIRIKKALWRAMTEDGTEFNLDLKEFFEDRYVENGKLVIPKGLYRKMFPRDPLVGREKFLEIEFTHGGQWFFVILQENISVTLPFPYAVTSERMT